MKRHSRVRRWPVLVCLLVLGPATLVQSGRAAEHSLPLVLPAGNEALMGFVRIVNRSNRSGTVDIRAIDDTGVEGHPVSLSIEANASRHFNSVDLESGESSKGLPGGVGDGQCSWRLELETDLDILPLAFVRTGDGFVTSIHDVVPEVEPGRYDVAILNPGKNMTQQGRLRLVNPGDAPAEVEISGTDDGGNPSPGKAQITVPAGGACTITAHELESGDADDPCHCEVSGSLGAGSGKWQVSVTANRSIQVMSVLKTPEHLTNLSTVKYAGFSPVDEAGFNARFVGRRVQATDGSGYVDFVSSGRFSESYEGRMYAGDYTYDHEGPNSGTLVFNYDDGDECKALAAFDSFITGTTLSVCEDGVTNELELQPIRSWELKDIEPTGTAPADQDEFNDLVASQRFAPDAGSSLGAPVVFVSPGQFSQASGASQRTGTYTYRNTGRSSGTVVLDYAGGGACTLDLEFESDTAGSMDYTCVDASNISTTGSTNWRLEYVGTAEFAPADQNAFDARFVGKRIVTDDPNYWLDITSSGRFTENDVGDFYDGSYTYVKTGGNSGTVDLRYDDGDQCTLYVTFDSATSGSANLDCGYVYSTSWRAVDLP